jgi:hypothetical protein
MKNEFANAEKEVISTPQSLYDSFNEFIFSSDTKVLAKLIARANLFNQVIDVPGDIVECGVFKGSGIFTWIKLKHILAPNIFKKVMGFDFFDTESLLNGLSGVDKERMSDLFLDRNFSLDNSYQQVLESTILESGFSRGDFELIAGDVSETSHEVVNNRPGFKISLLYMDLDLGDPTYEALCAFWPRVSKGGIVVLDEYAYHQWSESKGVDRFAEEHDLQIKPLHYNAPTAYIEKK